MSAYQLQTLSYKGLQVTPNEKSFLEILSAKVLNPRAHKSDIRSEEKRLIQEANLRRHGELVHNVVSRPALPDQSQPAVAKPAAPVPPKSANLSSILTKEEFEPEETNKNSELSMDVDEDVGNTFVAPDTTSRIRKKQRVDAEEEEEMEIIYYFPQEGVVGSPKPWYAGSAVNAAEYPLKQFSFDGNMLIKAKLRIPDASNGWAFNITPLSDIFSTNIYFHFNPRYKKDKVYMNNKYGTWGDELKIAAGKQYERNDIKANDIMLKVYIHTEGFLVFANNIFTAFFPKRHLTHSLDSDLKIVFPFADANGKAYDVRVDQVWWGPIEQEKPMSSVITPEIDLLMEAAIATRNELPNVVSPMAPRTIIIRNMPISKDLYDLQDLEFMITDKLESDIGKETMGAISISLVRGASFGYARFVSSDMALKAAEVISTIEIDDDERGMTFHFQASLVQEGEIGHEVDGQEDQLEN